VIALSVPGGLEGWLLPLALLGLVLACEEMGGDDATLASMVLL
jgi:hypothetical protein